MMATSIANAHFPCVTAHSFQQLTRLPFFTANKMVVRRGNAKVACEKRATSVVLAMRCRPEDASPSLRSVDSTAELESSAEISGPPWTFKEQQYVLEEFDKMKQRLDRVEGHVYKAVLDAMSDESDGIPAAGQSPKYSLKPPNEEKASMSHSNAASETAASDEPKPSVNPAHQAVEASEAHGQPMMKWWAQLRMACGLLVAFLGGGVSVALCAGCDIYYFKQEMQFLAAQISDMLLGVASGIVMTLLVAGILRFAMARPMKQKESPAKRVDAVTPAK